MSKLANCPFCGSEAICDISIRQTHEILCRERSCCCTEMFEEKEDAINADMEAGMAWEDIEKKYNLKSFEYVSIT